MPQSRVKDDIRGQLNGEFCGPARFWFGTDADRMPAIRHGLKEHRPANGGGQSERALQFRCAGTTASFDAIRLRYATHVLARGPVEFASCDSRAWHGCAAWRRRGGAV